MPTTLTEIRPGAYFDSVVLMHLQRSLTELPGVIDAGVVMATPANCFLLGEGNLYPAEAEAARSDDLLIVVRAKDGGAAADALAQVDDLLAARRSTGSRTGYRPHTIAGALDALPDARWLLVSVPGRYAAGVARQGLDAGLNVFLYSDNVTIEDELALKETASAKGLIVMGPDCGTAIINGIGLGFANRVRRGPIGLVGASGTGLQAVTSAIHNLGSGISHAFGTGGRDLKGAIGGITTLQALETLAEDPGTAVIVLVSKPPDPEVAAAVLSAARRIAKPIVVNFIGYPAPAERLGDLHFAVNLSEAASIAVQLANAEPGEGRTASVEPVPSGRYLRGLFSGGTLAVETVLGLQNLLHPLSTNVPLRPDQDMDSPMESRGHAIVDLGEDVFTQGRLHPMMDNDLRIRRIRQEAEDSTTGLILLDVVLGEGAHPDPAAELAPVVAELTGKHKLPVIAVLIGTDEDPQDRDAQAERLAAAGAQVFLDLQAALMRVAEYFPAQPARTGVPIPAGALAGSFAAINAGLETFSESLAGQGAAAVQMDWRPPAGGNEKMAGILERLRAASGG